jgi:hypothetical protein
MPTTCKDFGGRGRYRTADRWCVKPSQSVHGVARGAIASSNSQLNGWFASHSVHGLSGCVCLSWHTLGTTGVWSSEPGCHSSPWRSGHGSLIRRTFVDLDKGEYLALLNSDAVLDHRLTLRRSAKPHFGPCGHSHLAAWGSQLWSSTWPARAGPAKAMTAPRTSPNCSGSQS